MMNLMILKWTMESDPKIEKLKKDIGGRYGS